MRPRHASTEWLVHVTVKNEIDAIHHRPLHDSFGIKRNTVNMSANWVVSVCCRHQVMMKHQDAVRPRLVTMSPPHPLRSIS